MDDSLYYYARNNSPVGPVSFDEIKRLVESGELSVDTFVIQPGESEWRPYSLIACSRLANIPDTSTAIPTPNDPTNKSTFDSSATEAPSRPTDSSPIVNEEQSGANATDAQDSASGVTPSQPSSPEISTEPVPAPDECKLSWAPEPPKPADKKSHRLPIKLLLAVMTLAAICGGVWLYIRMHSPIIMLPEDEIKTVIQSSINQSTSVLDVVSVKKGKEISEKKEDDRLSLSLYVSAKLRIKEPVYVVQSAEDWAASKGRNASAMAKIAELLSSPDPNKISEVAGITDTERETILSKYSHKLYDKDAQITLDNIVVTAKRIDKGKNKWETESPMLGASEEFALICKGLPASAIPQFDTIPSLDDPSISAALSTIVANAYTILDKVKEAAISCRQENMLQPGVLYSGYIVKGNDRQIPVYLEIISTDRVEKTVRALFRNDGCWSDIRKFEGRYSVDASQGTINLTLTSSRERRQRGCGPLMDWDENIEVDLHSEDTELSGNYNRYKFVLDLVPTQIEKDALILKCSMMENKLRESVKLGKVYMVSATATQRNWHEDYTFTITRNELDGGVLDGVLEDTHGKGWKRHFRGRLITNTYIAQGKPLVLSSGAREQVSNADAGTPMKWSGWGPGNLEWQLAYDDGVYTCYDGAPDWDLKFTPIRQDSYAARRSRIAEEQYQAKTTPEIRSSENGPAPQIITPGTRIHLNINSGTGVTNPTQLTILVTTESTFNFVGTDVSQSWHYVKYASQEAFLMNGPVGTPKDRMVEIDHLIFTNPRSGTFNFLKGSDYSGTFTISYPDDPDDSAPVAAPAPMAQIKSLPLPPFPRGKGAYLLIDDKWQKMDCANMDITHRPDSEFMADANRNVGSAVSMGQFVMSEPKPTPLLKITVNGHSNDEIKPPPVITVGQQATLVYRGQLKKDLRQYFDVHDAAGAIMRVTNTGPNQWTLDRFAVAGKKLPSFEHAIQPCLVERPASDTYVFRLPSDLPPGTYGLYVLDGMYLFSVSL